MKKETKDKLKTLALHLGNKWGKDFTQRDDFHKLCKQEADKLKLKIHAMTLRAYLNELKDYIINLDYTTPFDNHNVINLEKLTEPILDISDVSEVIIKYKSGSHESFKKPETQIWSGLFEYKTDGIWIRCGKYAGCNVKSSESLKKYFNNYLDLYGYVLSCLQPGLLNKISDYRNEKELELNIKTLQELKEKIEMRSQFTTTLKQIRKRKGFES